MLGLGGDWGASLLMVNTHSWPPHPSAHLSPLLIFPPPLSLPSLHVLLPVCPSDTSTWGMPCFSARFPVRMPAHGLCGPGKVKGPPCALPANSAPHAHLPRGSDLQQRLRGGPWQAGSTLAHLGTCHSHRGTRSTLCPAPPTWPPALAPGGCRCVQEPGRWHLLWHLLPLCLLPASSLPVIPAGSGLSLTFLGTFWRFRAFPQWKDASRIQTCSPGHHMHTMQVDHVLTLICACAPPIIGGKSGPSVTFGPCSGPGPPCRNHRKWVSILSHL